jgi:hypothetical protein
MSPINAGAALVGNIESPETLSMNVRKMKRHEWWL